MNFIEQYLFKLGNKENYLEDDYILGEANIEAFEYLKQYPLWASEGFGRMVYLSGKQSSGKTHLASIWQNDTGALKILERDFYNEDIIEKVKSRKFLIIEDIEKLIEFEKKLFFIINIVSETNAFLLVTSKFTPQNIDFYVRDLVSRLKAFNHIEINDPDLEILKGVFIKLLSDRQLRVPAEVLNFIIQRVKRTFADIEKIVNKLDQLSLSAKRNITIPFIKEHLLELNL